MRNRNLILNILSRMEGCRVNLRRIVNTNQPIQEYIKEMDKLEELMDQLTGMIEDEPLDRFEQNKI